MLKIKLSSLRVIDDSEEPYLYSISRPSSLEKPNEEYRKWELVETNNKLIEEVFKTQNSL